MLTTVLFALFVVMLPRYTDTAKTWFALLILAATIFLAFNWRQLRETSRLERLFFAVLIANFAWIAFTFYYNGEPGRGASFVWGRHFYMLFMLPLFFLMRSVSISDKTLVIVVFSSILLSFSDVVIDLIQGIDHREQGMNPNAFGPIQVCLSGIMFFYFLKLPRGTLKWLALAGVIIGLPTVLLSLSRATWVSLVVVSVFFVFYLARSAPAWKKATIAGLILALLASSYALPMIKARVDRAMQDIAGYYASEDYRDTVRRSSVGVRVELWKAGWKMFLENPLTGVGVGGFKVAAEENWERYQVNEVVGHFKYVHNQYIAALATRGVPGLILFLLLLTLPLYIAMSQRSADRGLEIARLSLMLICMVYLVGCLVEDHFEGKSAPMFVTVFFALLLARLSPVDTSRPKDRL